MHQLHIARKYTHDDRIDAAPDLNWGQPRPMARAVARASAPPAPPQEQEQPTERAAGAAGAASPRRSRTSATAAQGTAPHQAASAARAGPGTRARDGRRRSSSRRVPQIRQPGNSVSGILREFAGRQQGKRKGKQKGPRSLSVPWTTATAP
jgi:hypothetical protein